MGMKNRLQAEHVAAYKRAHILFRSRGLKPKLLRLDNEASLLLTDFLTTEDVAYQLCTAHQHRANAAERAIRTFKNHFIEGLSSTDNAFPLNLWNLLLPQAIITLNLLRTSRMNPKLSAYAQVHGQIDFNVTPIGPPGTKVQVHNKPDTRESFQPHGSDGWYVGPSLHHYRNYK
jgi:hypothetical protein